MRRLIAFPCAGETLVGTLDEGEGTTGLLIVSGGNEIRVGAHRGMAELAAALAAEGVPVFRFDRRGVGDSTGENLGYAESAPDIAAAAAVFAAEARVTRLVGFGNCDAASALMLSNDAGFDALVLANPWTIEDADDLTPPPAAVRARYADKLRNRKELMRLLTGKVSVSKLVRGIVHALRPAPPPSSLAQQLKAGLARFAGPTAILLAGRDRTAQMFEAAWDKADHRISRLPDASHAFVEPHAREWLAERVLSALAHE